MNVSTAYKGLVERSVVMSTVSFRGKEVKSLLSDVIQHVVEDLGLKANVYVWFPRCEDIHINHNAENRHEIHIIFQHKSIDDDGYKCYGNCIHGINKFTRDPQTNIRVSTKHMDSYARLIETTAHELRHAKQCEEEGVCRPETRDRREMQALAYGKEVKEKFRVQSGD